MHLAAWTRRGGAAGRTPLWAALRRALLLAREANRPGAPPVDELVGRAQEAAASRRRFLRATAAAGLAGGLVARTSSAGVGEVPARARSRRRGGPRIVVVGAGLAGLRATLALRDVGLNARLYTAEARPGGRVSSIEGLLGPGLVTELGGEFINSDHVDMILLARRFGLELTNTTAMNAGLATAYHFGGRSYSPVELVEAFRPLAAQIDADLRGIGDNVTYFHSTPYARQIDRMNLAEYLVSRGLSGFLYQLLDAAYTTEYGLDLTGQSPLNLLFLIGTDTSDGFPLFGDSDERFTIRGGNAQIPQAMAAELSDRIEPGSVLESLRLASGGYVLTFAGRPAEVRADIVLLCLPFTKLRQVALRVPLPPVKRLAIDTLGYGTNAKLLVGYTRPVWRERGFGGDSYTDLGYQNSWENGYGHPFAATGLTIFTGGATGASLSQGRPEDQAARFAPAVEAVFPGTAAAASGAVGRAHWPGWPWSIGSYACYEPGQWTSLAGSEFEPVGNLFFAGEHCSQRFQGYMNGAAQTGRQAAARIASRVYR